MPENKFLTAPKAFEVISGAMKRDSTLTAEQALDDLALAGYEVEGYRY